MRKNGGVIGLVISFAGSALALPQEPPTTDVPGVGPGDGSELAAVSEMEMGPQDLPGREKGERDRKPASEPEPKTEAEGISFWKRDRVTGDWWGARTKLENTGINFNGSFTMHAASVVDGGASQDSSVRTLWNFNIEFDFEKMCGWNGSSVFVDFMSSDEESVLADAGSFQGPSGIEFGRNIDEVGELWFQQKMWDGVARLKVGKIDANSEFAYVNAAADQQNMSACASPTILYLPTVPAQATGIVAFVYPTDAWYIGAGWFDGATQDGIRTGGRGPADFFSDSRSQAWYWIAETGYSWSFESMGSGRAAVGGWHASGDFARFDGNIEEGTEGFYALAEQQVWQRGEDDENKDKGVFVYTQYGWADKDVTVFGQHIAVGATLKGVCSERSDDTMGVYWSMIDASKDVLTGADRDEHLFEANYKAQITPWLYVQPSVQYIINPSGRVANEDVTILGVQLGVTF